MKSKLPKAGPPSALKPARATWLTALALLAMTFAVYSPILSHDFLNYDDDRYITGNPAVRLGLSREGVRWAFGSSFGANWFPLTWLSLLLDYDLYGLRAQGFLLTNLLLHCASVALLFVVFVRMTGALGPSAFVAGVFALHPLHVESVAWVAERKDVLSGLFWMLTLLAYAHYAENATAKRYALVAISLALGLMAKPMLVTLPFVLLLLDVWPLGRLRRAAVLEKVPLFMLVAMSSVVTYLVQQSAGAVQPLERFSLQVRLLNALNAYLSYVIKAFWPRGLAVYYPHPGETVSVAGAAAGALFLLGVSLFAWKTLKKHPYLFVGWLWFVGALVPVMGLVQVGEQAMADRYTYLPLIGLSVMAAWGVPRLLPARAAGLAGAVALLALAVATLVQARVWKNSVTLFEHALEVTRDNPLAHLNLGIAFLNTNRLDEAASHLSETVRLHPGSAEGYAALGAVRARQGKTRESIEHFNRSLRLDPASAQTHDGLGSALIEEGDAAQALAHFREAVALDPGLAIARINLAERLVEMGAATEAEEHLRVALALKPGDAKALEMLGVVLVRQGKNTEAIELFRDAVLAQPNYARAHFGWAKALLGRRQFKEAVEHYREAVRLSPEDVEIRTSLGFALANLGELPAAAEEFRRALATQAGYAQAHHGLGLVLANQARFAEAVEHFRAAAAADPENYEALFYWGLALSNQGRFKEAASRYQAALALQPRYPEAQNGWAMALAREGRVKEATEHFRAAVALDEANPDAHNNLGVYLVQQGALAEAVKCFERALQLRPDDPTARTNLEKTRTALGRSRS